jgi:hypothetical protein
MDELMIGDEKYISSKRAAEITGYAKDYIGQLCREGRVKARLVGRSWYVREAAIKDHRFGLEIASPEPAKQEAVVDTDLEQWESPKYEADLASEIPLVAEKVPEEQPAVDMAMQMQEAWQTWFSHYKPEESQEGEELLEIQKVPQEAEIEAETPVAITRVEEVELPEEEPRIEPAKQSREIRHSYRGLRAVLFVIAVAVIAFTSFGTGLLEVKGTGLVASVIEFISGTKIYSK